MKKALVLVYSDLKHDARVTRQIGFLSGDFQVTAAAYGDNHKPDHEFIDLKSSALTILRKVRIAVWSLLGQYDRAWDAFHPIGDAARNLRNRTWDLIVANDVDALPLAYFIKGSTQARVAVDAHEYSPRQFENLAWWRLIFQPALNWICRTYLTKADVVFTVGQGIADAYRKNFGCDPIVITNAPSFRPGEPSEVLPGKIRLVHHGIANASRRPELMFELMQKLDDRFSLDLYLMTSGYASGKTRKYIDDLKKLLTSDPRIRVLDPLPQHEIVPTLNRYDIGIFLLPPVNFNYANALPNKFFDFIQARLAVAIGASPEMAGFVMTFRNGVVANDFEPASLAQKLSELTDETLREFKHQSAEAASLLCAENNAVIFDEAIHRIF